MKNKLYFVLVALFLSLLTNIVLSQEEEIPFILEEGIQEEEPEQGIQPEPQVEPLKQEPAPLLQVPISRPTAQNKISLDIKGMDIVDVLKMLATRGGMNIVVGKNVTGRVTLFLKDVDIWDVFEIIILANDLAYEKKAEIINVMTQRDYELLYGERYQDKKEAKVIPLKYAKAADLSRALNQIKTNIGRVVVDEGSNTLVLIDTPAKLKEMEDFIKNTDLPIQTRVFGLNYAQADKLSPKIQEALTKGIGSLKIDERTNKIAVTDYPAKLDEIAKVISAFDEKTPQVLIDAQIIQLTPSDEFKMGVDWDFWIRKYFKTTIPLTGGGIGIGATGSVSEVGQYKAILDLLRTIGDTKILSSPRIIALNNQESKILVGTKEAYVKEEVITSTTGPAQTTKTPEFIDVGIKLFVTPTINQDGFATMKIRPEISSVDKYKDFGTTTAPYQVPIVTTSEAETTVTIKDGVTILIGGLTKDKRVKKVDKIPVLGDIPGLGYLFRRTTDELTKTELVILLTPHIMSGESPYTDFSEIKPKDGAVVKMVKGEIVTERVVEIQEKESVEKISSQYYSLVSDKVKALVSFGRPEKEKGKVKVSFTLNSDGQLKDEPLVISSTNHLLDNLAIKSIKDASPFPPFPQSFEKKEEIFKISLSYE